MSSWPVFRASAYAEPPTHCFPQNDFLYWLSSSFQTCVPTPLALLTTVLGSLSFLAWLFAQLPQIYKNYKMKSTAGLSIYFLVEWLLGDTTNLAGAILCKQATWQILIASYYTFVDCVMVGQFVYYTKYLPRRATRLGRKGGAADDGDEAEGSASSTPARALPYRTPRLDSASSSPAASAGTDPKDIPFGSYRFPSFLSSPREKGTARSNRKLLRPSTDASPAASPRAMLLICLLLAVVAQASPISSAYPDYQSTEATSGGTRELAGKIVSWTSTLLYLVSRLPQIIKNARRRSTSGLSLSLFVAAFFGNFFYSASLLTNPLAWSSYPAHGYYGWADADGSDRQTWVLLALPFWLGAAGVLSLDLTIGIQFMMYGGVSQPPKLVEVRDDRGREQWRRVSGWMRGWVPSPGPVFRVPAAAGAGAGARVGGGTAEQRPLLGGRPSSRTRPPRSYGGD